MGTRQWLSEGAEALVRRLEVSKAQPFDCEVLIVGSGYGGAVAAARLAGTRRKAHGAPVDVLVLERGREYLPGMFPSRFADIPGHVRFSSQDGAPPSGRAEGLFDFRIGKSVNVLVASGLGGGSLINAAVMARPKPEAFASGWPAGVDAATLSDPCTTVENMLQVDDFAAATLPKLDSLMALGEAMGAHERSRAKLAIRSTPGDTQAGVARAKCLQCGDCVSGCNHAAKNSLDFNYLRLALARGARFYCGATLH
jgi:choline dehydrogenase-like flavoprotein